MSSSSSTFTDELFGAKASAQSDKASLFEPKKRTNLELFAIAPQVKIESRREKRRRLEAEAKEGPAAKKSSPSDPTSQSVLENVHLIEKVPAHEHGPQTSEKKKKPTRLRHALQTNEDEDRRTVFVGNLPNNVDKKVLTKAFRDCGDIESVRVRNQVLEEESTKKRGRAIRVLRGDIKQGEQFSACGYVLFKSVDAVPRAVAKSGLVVQGRHVSVTQVDDASKSFPSQTSVFLGNLSYDTSEEDVWSFFLEHNLGDIKRVRLVRDKDTGLGKGFGYVEFAKQDSVAKAIQTRGNLLKGREVRMCHVSKDKKLASKKPSRRDTRQANNRATTALGPLTKNAKSASGGQQRTTAPAAQPNSGQPSWMGIVTNPRRKMPRDLRPLVTDSGVKKKQAKKFVAPGGPKKKEVASRKAS